MTRARWFIVLAMVVFGALLASGGMARVLTHRKHPPTTETATVLSGLKAEPLRLTASDGIETGAWLYVPPAPKCLVILAHGNGSQRQALLGYAQEFVNNGCAALPITLRAHGDSGGELNDFGYGARLDIQAAVQLAQQRSPGTDIYIFGQSLGAAAALFAAPDLGDQIKGYLLESPYASLEGAVKNRLRMRLPQLLVTPGYHLLALWASRFLDVPIADIAPTRAAAKIRSKARFIVLAGGQDLRATPSEARAVVDALPAGARLEIFDNAAHSELWGRDQARYRKAMQSLTEPTK